MWISEKEQPAGKDGENANSWDFGGQDDSEDGILDEIPLKEGKDGDEAASSNGTGSNETSWVGFNAESRGFRGQEESADGILDQIPFLDNLEMESSRNEIELL